MKKDQYTYRCPLMCPINKKCYIITTVDPIPITLRASVNCTYKKENIIVPIGNQTNTKPP